MSLWFFFKLFFLIIYSAICFKLASIMYKYQKKYYKPILIKKKAEKGKNDDEIIISLHDEFDEFSRKDSPPSFIKLFCGTFTLFFFKIIVAFSFAYNLSRKLSKKIKEKEHKKETFTKEEIKLIKENAKFTSSWFLRFSGILFKKSRLPDAKILSVYKKYFGPDYKIDYDGKFCCYLSNHTSFNDILLAMAIYGCSFISKDGVKKTPIIGNIAKGLQSIFVDRNDSASKEKTLEQIIKRQKEFIEGKPVMPFMIFPEGTTSSGRHLLAFKRGAFISLLPIKPNIILPNLNNDFHLGCGATDVEINYGRTLTNLYVQTEFIELPIMTPNEYMYNNYSHYGKEKWEIYKEVTRDILSELGGFKKSDKEFIDSSRYNCCVNNETFIEKKDYKPDKIF